MKSLLPPRFLLRRHDEEASDLAHGVPGLARYRWEGRFGPMLIEVRGETVYVNGEAVEPAVGIAPAAGPHSTTPLGEER